LVASMALVSVLLGSSVAVAHPLMFESDLTEDGLINFCNREQLKVGLFEGPSRTGTPTPPTTPARAWWTSPATRVLSAN
jgi:hypothetical protein